MYLKVYLNYGAIIFMTIVLVANIIIEILAKTNGIFFSILITGMIGYMFIAANNQFETAKSNTKEFQTGAVLKCHIGGGLYSGSETYRVSIKDGWEYDKEYFVKDSISIRVNKCEGW